MALAYRCCRIGSRLVVSTHRRCSYPVHTSNYRYGNQSLPTLTMYTKEECSLCDDAKEILSKYSDRFVLEQVYIDKPENKRAFAQYRYDIPVFHFNEQYLMKHRVNEQLLEEKLQEHDNVDPA